MEERHQESYHAYYEAITHMEDIMKQQNPSKWTIAKGWVQLGFRVMYSLTYKQANRDNFQALLKRASRKDKKFEFL
jgi:hypothetical protein